MIVTLQIVAFPDVLKHLIPWFKTTDIGCRWYEATLPQAI